MYSRLEHQLGPICGYHPALSGHRTRFALEDMPGYKQRVCINIKVSVCTFMRQPYTLHHNGQLWVTHPLAWGHPLGCTRTPPLANSDTNVVKSRGPREVTCHYLEEFVSGGRSSHQCVGVAQKLAARWGDIACGVGWLRDGGVSTRFKQMVESVHSVLVTRCFLTFQDWWGGGLHGSWHRTLPSETVPLC